MRAKNWTILYGNWRTQRKNNTMRNCRRCKGSPKDSRAGQTTCRIARPLIALCQFLRYPGRGGHVANRRAHRFRGRAPVSRPVCVPPLGRTRSSPFRTSPAPFPIGQPPSDFRAGKCIFKKNFYEIKNLRKAFHHRIKI